MKVDNLTLADGTPWRLFTPDNAQNGWAVLWLQGFTSTIEGHNDGCERMSAASNVPFAILNYAGHGNHPTPLEQATRKQQFEEVCAVYDELVNRGLDKIIVIGGSFGGYMAALLAGVRQPQAVVLRAAANYKDEEFERPYLETTKVKSEEGKAFMQSVDEAFSNKATEALKAFDGASYIIEHEADTVIRANIPRSYYHVAKHGNYIVMRGLEHSPKLMPNAAEWFDIVEHWVQTIIHATVHDPRDRP